MTFASVHSLGPWSGYSPPYGNVRYVYKTRDGHCPNGGVPPKSAATCLSIPSNVTPSLYRCSPVALVGTTPVVYIPIGPQFRPNPTPPRSGMLFYPSRPAPLPYQASQQPPPPPRGLDPPLASASPQQMPLGPPPYPQPRQQSQHLSRATDEKKPSPKASRVPNKPPRYSSRKPPVLSPQDTCFFHIYYLERNHPRPWDNGAPSLKDYQYRELEVPTNFTVKEFLQHGQIRDVFPSECPANYIGVSEGLLPSGPAGHITKGSSFYLADNPHVLDQTLAQVGWTNDRGRLGNSPPVLLFVELQT